MEHPSDETQDRPNDYCITILAYRHRETLLLQYLNLSVNQLNSLT